MGACWARGVCRRGRRARCRANGSVAQRAPPACCMESDRLGRRHRQAHTLELPAGPVLSWQDAEEFLQLLPIETDDYLIVDEGNRCREDFQAFEVTECFWIRGNIALDERYVVLRKPRFLRVAEHSSALCEEDHSGLRGHPILLIRAFADEELYEGIVRPSDGGKDVSRWRMSKTRGALAPAARARRTRS